jgi:hypothetical protein
MFCLRLWSRKRDAGISLTNSRVHSRISPWWTSSLWKTSWSKLLKNSLKESLTISNLKQVINHLSNFTSAWPTSSELFLWSILSSSNNLVQWFCLIFFKNACSRYPNQEWLDLRKLKKVSILDHFARAKSLDRWHINLSLPLQETAL